MPEKKKITIVTHNGSFHSDDIFGVATLRLLFSNENQIEIIRTRDEAQIEKADYVLDVGGIYDENKNRFDHHQKNVPPRENGVPYASFGLVWKKFGQKLAGEKEVANFAEKRLVYPIDARDNGVDISASILPEINPYELRDLVAVFKTTWKEDKSVLYDRFIYLVSLAEEIIKREIIFAQDFLDGKKKIKELYSNLDNPKILVLDKHYPFEGIGADFPELLLVVYPDIEEAGEKWCLECIRDKYESYKSRINLPESWAGMVGDDLAKISGVPEAVFCHKARFFAVAKTKEAALKLAQLALDENKDN